MQTFNGNGSEQCQNAVVMTTADYTGPTDGLFYDGFFYIYPNVDATIKVDLKGKTGTGITFNVFAGQILPIQFSKFYNTGSTNHSSLIAIY